MDILLLVLGIAGLLVGCGCRSSPPWAAIKFCWIVVSLFLQLRHHEFMGIVLVWVCDGHYYCIGLLRTNLGHQKIWRESIWHLGFYAGATNWLFCHSCLGNIFRSLFGSTCGRTYRRDGHRQSLKSRFWFIFRLFVRYRNEGNFVFGHDYLRRYGLSLGIF